VCIFVLKKSCEIAAGCSGPAFLIPPTDMALSSEFSVQRILFLRKIREVTNSKCSAFASSELLRPFFTSNSAIFADGGAKILFAPRRRVPLVTPLRKENKIIKYKLESD